MKRSLFVKKNFFVADRSEQQKIASTHHRCLRSARGVKQYVESSGVVDLAQGGRHAAFIRGVWQVDLRDQGEFSISSGKCQNRFGDEGIPDRVESLEGVVW